ncbi:MAG TPA: ATP-binding cassette domain-containing protein [Gaiellales bacterium]|nr:ATP-binding cassette domain-containing protein [Gaiellales bacterium]
MDALRFESVSYHYPGDGRPALDDVDLSVEAGQFVLLVGGSGSGKSTLLRAAAGLVPHFHGGRLEGRVTAEGMDTRDHDPRQIARVAGLVFQDPERQLVMRRARREVAFGLENLGYPAAEIAARAEEAMMVTGASRLAERPVERLSGGEQQRIAIASILAMGHRLLLLDEPTSQLDPVAAEELLGLIVRINRDRGVTVVLAEHRTGRLFAEADRVIQLEAGAVIVDDPPAVAAAAMALRSRWLLPPVAQAFAAAGRSPLPLSVREARRLVPHPAPPPVGTTVRAEPAVAIEHGHKMLGEVSALRDATAGFAAGRVTAMVGENGAGKTTLALALCGLLDLDRGRVRRAGRAGYVSQNPAHYLLHETVADEVAYGLRNLGVAGAEETRRVAAELRRFDLDELAGRHPRDLSSGERQRLAIATVTVMRPDLLVLDEPTRGVDGRRKHELAGLTRELADDGAGVVVVTHDMDFAADVADEVTTLAAGRVLTDRGPRSVLATSQFFVSQVGLALGVASVAEASRMLEAVDTDPVNA